MSVKVEKISEPLVLGEGPHWDARQQALFYVDILPGTIHKYCPRTRLHTKTKLDGRVGFIVPVEGTTDQFLVGLERTFAVVRWDGAEGSAAPVLRELAAVDGDVDPPTRINDGKADPRGRVFAGTMGYEEPLGNIMPGKGSLYRVDGGGVTKLCSEISVSNGLAWDLKRKAFYYVDTFEFNVRRYDYDVDTGEISKTPKHIFDLKKNNIEAYPDGITIDSDGNLWIALFKGDGVIKVDPTTGALLQKVSIPAHQVTSVTFGGPDYDVLFVTTAGFEVNGEKQEPPCGCIFAVTGLGVKGLPNENFKLT